MIKKYKGVEILIAKGEHGYNSLFKHNGEIHNCVIGASSADSARITTQFRIDYMRGRESNDR